MDTLTSFDGAMKEMYDDQTVAMMVYGDSGPLLNWIPKRENFFGRLHPLPVLYAAPNGASANFQQAQANQQPASIAEFLVRRVRDYGIATLQNELIEAADGDAGSFMDAAGPLVNAAVENVGRRISSGLFRDTSGKLAQLTSGSGVATTLTLLNLEDLVLFEVGQTLVASTQSDGSQIKQGTMLVTGIDRTTGTLTVTSGANLNPVLAVSDYLYVAGDPQSKMNGLASWIPVSSPTSSDSFFGVNRSVDVDRLAGIRHTASGAPIKEALIDLAVKIVRIGRGKPEAAFLNPTDWAALDKTLEASVVRSDVKMETGFSFRAIELMAPHGVVKVMADRDCPVGQGWMLEQKTLTFKTLRGAPRVLDRDGKFLRVANADAYEVRIGWYGNLECDKPGSNGTVTF